VENLLLGFLTGALGIELIGRIDALEDLPAAFRRHVQLAKPRGAVCAAWSTHVGPVAACGQYDLQGSRQLTAYLLFVEWWDTSNGHHALWAHCDAKRPNEWTIGRGWQNESL
jgi:hypothetical protein